MALPLLKSFAKTLKIDSLIDQAGMRGPVADWLNRLGDAHRREIDRIIEADYRATRQCILPIARSLIDHPATGIAWMFGSNSIWGYKMEAMLLLALRLIGYSPVVVETQYGRWCRRYHRLFGNSTFIDFSYDRRRTDSVEPDPLWAEFVAGRPTVPDLLELRYRQVDVGRIVLSNILYKNKFSKFDIRQPETLREIHRELIDVQRNVLAAERMLSSAPKPSLALVLEKGKSPYAELFGVCIAQGIPVIQFNHSQNRNDLSLKRYTLSNRYQHPFSLDDSTWAKVKRMAWDGSLEENLLSVFKRSYTEGSWFNRKYLHQDKQIKSPEEVKRQLRLDPHKKTAVIFSHVLWDATFFYGRNVFDDYETWLIETVRAACANPRVNWIVKFHPDLVWKLKLEGYSGQLRDALAIRSSVESIPEHVQFVLPDTDISTYSFFSITDYCLTVRGTIGIEMACHGVPVLTAGTGRYSGLGFTIDSDTREEYLDRVASIQAIPPMNPTEIELARRFAHTLFNIRPWKLRSFAHTQLPIDQVNHPLSMNLVPAVDTAEKFANARDIRRFVDWVASEESDYLDEDL